MIWVQHLIRRKGMANVHREKKTKLYIQPDAGLGNRLYCLYSALYYAKKMGRSFDVIWLRETCCNVPFSTLFDKSFLPENTRIHTTYHLGYRNRYALFSLISDLYMKGIKKRFKYYTSEDTRSIFHSEGERSIRRLIEDGTNKCIKANTKFFDLDHFGEVRSLIKPSQEIISVVDAVMVPLDASKVIGVHIRRTDNKASIENSPIEAFYEVLDNIVKQDENVKIYLATDDEQVEHDFAARYDCIRHRTFSGVKSRNSVKGMMDAYVDMLCLSRCEKIYGSYGSSFSQLASLIGNIELEVVGNKQE